MGRLAGEAATLAQCGATQGSGSLDENASCQGVRGAKQLRTEAQPEGLNLQLIQMTVVIMQPIQPQASSAHHVWVATAGLSRKSGSSQEELQDAPKGSPGVLLACALAQEGGNGEGGDEDG